MKVSVAIPAYNGEAFIREAVKSVLSQTYSDFELLIVDDRSTDATFDVIRSIADPRIRVTRNDERLGLPRNWNRCLSLAKGEYLCLFHQDDVMLPGNLEKKVQCLTSDPGLAFVHSSAELKVEKSAPTPPIDWIEGASEDFVQEGKFYFYKLLFRGNVICAPTVMARRQRFLDLGGFDDELSFTSDYEMWLKLCLDGRVAFLSQPLIRYRWHEKNASHEFRYERGVEESLLAARRAVKYFLEKTGQSAEATLLEEAVVAIARHKRWAAELERAKFFLEDDRGNWQKVAEEKANDVQRLMKDLKDLEEGKSWLENEVKNWQDKVSEQEKMIQEQKAWIHELETGKDWLAGQNEAWQKAVHETQARIELRLVKLEKRFILLLGLLFAAVIFLSPSVLHLLGRIFGLSQ